MDKNKYIILFILLLGFSCGLKGQPVDSLKADSVVVPKHPQYAFLNMGANPLENDSTGMRAFYQKLRLLENGVKDKLVIVHIGDSHIQADFFSGMLRTNLQSRFGNAGRGLIFPYKVAGTNSPTDLRSSSNSTWEAKRNVFPNQPLPIGISGITIRTTDSNFVLQLGVTGNDSLDYSFDKVKIYCDRGGNCYDIHVSKATGTIPVPEYTTTSSSQYHVVQKGQTLSHIAGRYGCSVADLQRWNNLRGTLIYPGQKLAVNSVHRVVKPPPADAFKDYGVVPGEGNSKIPAEVNLGEKVSSVYLRGNRTSDTQKQCTIYGVVLENSGTKGILYNMVGVNGAKFEHYNVSEHFIDQLAALKPDLIIVSLGTNESMDPGFVASTFNDKASTFFQAVRKAAPSASVLLTAPPDNFLRRRYNNKRPMEVRDVLRQISKDNGFAFWNFYDVMGGYGSISTWKNAGLANYDRVHLTRPGYELQGKLLFDSLMKGFTQYKTRK